MTRTHAGWRGNILRIDLSSHDASIASCDDFMHQFVGGRGFAARLYWDLVSADVGALNPENWLFFMAGPLAGTTAVACSRLVVSGKSPLLYPEQYGHATLGGTFADQLKRAGFDGIAVTGKSSEPVVLIVTEAGARIERAEDLWGRDTKETLDVLRTRYGTGVEALAIGPAGERQVRFALIMGYNGACAGHGFGAVMGAKKLKAIVVMAGRGNVHVARPDELKELNRTIRALVRGRHLIDPLVPGLELVRREPCKGCPTGCARGLFRGATGEIEHRKNCASAYFYSDYDKAYHNGIGSGMSFRATSLADHLGMCTQEMTKILWWLGECLSRGIVKETQTGLPFSQLGSQEFLLQFVHGLIGQQGFCEVLAQGAMRAAQHCGGAATTVLYEILEGSGFSARLYNPRFFITNAIFHATDRTNPMAQLHEVCYPMFKWVLWYATDGAMSPITTETIREAARRFWQREDAVDFSKYEGKGVVAALIQNRAYAKETLVACDFFYPIIIAEGASDHIGDPAIESRLLSSVTGITYTEKDLLTVGERVFNLTRAIQVREGHPGRSGDTLPEFNFTVPLERDDSNYFELFNPEFILPGPDGTLIKRKGAVLDRKKFEGMLDEYYDARSWDKGTGLPT
ncbi:MAG: hypothetical protein N3B18_08615, partial [Desulfobacterota bacterium]|nr:hypothetical protein [Thermodesulfobacteriota bacterium]